MEPDSYPWLLYSATNEGFILHFLQQAKIQQRNFSVSEAAVLFHFGGSPVGLRAYKAISQPRRPKQMLLESENPFVDERPILLSHLVPF